MNKPTILKEIVYNTLKLLEKNKHLFSSEQNYIEFILSIKSTLTGSIVKNFLPNIDIRKFVENLDSTYENKLRERMIKFIEFTQEQGKV